MRTLAFLLIVALSASTAAAQEPPRGWVRPNQPAASAPFAPFVDIISMQRGGGRASADILMVSRAGSPAFPNYLIGRMEVDCAGRSGIVRNGRFYRPDGTLLRALGQDSPATPLSRSAEDQATWTLFCTPNGGNGMRAFRTIPQAIAEARR